MGGWRTKFIFLLIVYFSGFATAVYCLAPVPENQSDQGYQSYKGYQSYQPVERSFAYSALKSDEFAQSFNVGLHRCLDFGKDAVLRISKSVKQAYDERQRQNSE